MTRLILFVFAATTLFAGQIPHPTVFVENVGQWPRNVLYGAATPEMMVWITATGMICDQRAHDATGSMQHHAVSVDVIGSRGSHDVTTTRDAHTTPVYFSRANMSTAPRTASSVIVHNVKPGIHLEYVWDGTTVRYNVLVDAGTTLPTPLFHVDGARSLTPTADGFTCTTPLGSIRMSGLAAFSTLPSQQRSVTPMARGAELGFVVEGRKGGEAITVDPLVSAYAIHGSGTQEVTSMGLDRKGNVVVAGWTSSFDIDAPPNGASPSGAAGTDGFVACLSPDLKTILAWTYVAGDSNDVVRALAVSPLGDIWITGETNSKNLPVSTPKGGKYAGAIDGFVLRYSNDLSHVQSGLYIAGNGEDRPLGIACNAQGDAVVCGQSRSTSGMPSVKGYRATNNGGFDGFVMAIAKNGVDVENFTFIGGGADDALTTVAIDSLNSMVTAGWTSSNDVETFPVKTLEWVPDDTKCAGGYFKEVGNNAFDVDFGGGGTDVLAAKFAADGALLFTTYFGGAGEDRAKRLLVDNSGRVMIVGTTKSKDLPVTADNSNYNGKADIFAAALSADGIRLRTCVYFGAEGDDEAGDAQWDATGNTVITGSTTSTTLPYVGAGTSSDPKGKTDVLLAVVSATEVLFSTTFGWTGDERPAALSLNADGDCIIAGTTSSSFFGNTVAGISDGFVVKWAFGTMTVRTPLAGASFCTNMYAQATWTTDGVSKGTTFSVETTIDEGATWVQTATNIKGNSLSIQMPAQKPASGLLSFRVISSHGHVAASPATYSIKAGPVITAQPTSVTVESGTPVSFHVDATADGITYQWQRNGVNIDGATTSTYDIAAATTADQATYRCIIGSECGTLNSAEATVTIKSTVDVTPADAEQASLLIAPQPASDALRIGRSVPFVANVTISIHSMTGAEVLRHTSAPTSSVDLSVAGIPAGAYTLTIDDGTVTTHRMILIGH